MMFAAIILAAYLEGIDPNLLGAICYVESHFKNELPTRLDGRSHSWGICQVKFSTARDLGFRYPERDLHNPRLNARYAARYLRYQLGRYGGDEELAIRAYNCGSAHGKCGKGYLKKVKAAKQNWSDDL